MFKEKIDRILLDFYRDPTNNNNIINNNNDMNNLKVESICKYLY